jgi:ferredoxin
LISRCLDVLVGYSMKKVTIEPGCITCGSCEFIAPEVFKVTDRSRVRTDADIELHAQKIKEAARKCPVRVIAWQE